MGNKQTSLNFLMHVTYYPGTYHGSNGVNKEIIRIPWTVSYKIDKSHTMEAQLDNISGILQNYVMYKLLCGVDGVPIDKRGHTYRLAEYAAQHGHYCDWLKVYTFEIIAKKEDLTDYYLIMGIPGDRGSPR